MGTMCQKEKESVSEDEHFDSNQCESRKTKLAVVGCGLSGSLFTYELQRLRPDLEISVFDQGWGPGGRASTRFNEVDHGCQFFRSDTEITKPLVDDLLKKRIISKWEPKTFDDPPEGLSFFGFPNKPPFFYPTAGGMVGIVEHLCKSFKSENVKFYRKHRVQTVTPNGEFYDLVVQGGDRAIHDIPDEDRPPPSPDQYTGFHAVVFTDPSSTVFDSWHRASAGVFSPEFSAKVKERIPVRVVLFTAWIEFSEPVPDTVDAVTFVSKDVWFASRMSSKPGLEKNVWSIVATPDFSVREITKVPMQDPETGAFIPQDKSYLKTGPGRILAEEFRKLLGQKLETELSDFTVLGGQRWGSALPGLSRNPDEIKTVSRVDYDQTLRDLAPTKRIKDFDSFVLEEKLRLMQIGDGMSAWTPGAEGAMISAIQGAQKMAEIIAGKPAMST